MAVPQFVPVDSPDADARNRMLEVFSASPRGLSYGRLRNVAGDLAGWQGQVPPTPLSQPRVVVFAGDHGIAARGLSAYAPRASVEQAREIQAGGGPVNVFARSAGASVRLVDVSLDHEATGKERVSRSCGAIDVEDAMTGPELERALQIGRDIADQEVDAGADLLVPGDLGVGVTTVAAALMGVLSRTEPVAVVGPGSGITDELWKVKVSAIRDAMFRARGLQDQPLEILRRIGSPDIAALVGFISQAASRRTPVLLDGAPVTVAAFYADRLNEGVRHWLAAGQMSPEPSHYLALQDLGLTPLLALDLSTGQGCGALAALPLLTAAGELAGDEAESCAAEFTGGDPESAAEP